MCLLSPDRKNGKSIGPEGIIATSIQGSDDVHDDIHTGKSISLHLKSNDQLDAFVEDVIPNGSGLLHTTFCVSLIQQINDGELTNLFSFFYHRQSFCFFLWSQNQAS